MRSEDTFLRRHAVFVGSKGNAKYALTSVEARARNTDTDAPMSDSAYRAYVDDIVKSIRATSPSDTILLYVHGGRVGLNDGAKKSLELMPGIRAAKYYPLFIVWDASEWTALGWHLARYHRGLDYGHKPLAYVKVPLTVAADLVGAIARVPFTAGQQAGDLCRGTVRAVTGSVRPSAASCPIIHPDKQERARLTPIEDSTRAKQVAMSLADDPASRLGRNALEDSLLVSWGEYRLPQQKRIFRAATSVLYAPLRLPVGVILDGFGTGAWNDMVRRTNDMFRPASELRGPVPAGQQLAARPPSGAAGVLMEALQAMVKEDRTRPWRIILVGHSMGAIVGNRILREYPELPIARVQYLAPAASLAEIESSVIPFLRRRRDATFELATLHPFAEVGEMPRQFRLPPVLTDIVLPRGSLLEWVDAYFENSRSSFDRRAGKWRNVALGLHIFPAEVRSRVTVKAFGVGDPLDVGTRFEKGPSRHGDFDNVEYRFWCRDFWAIRHQGRAFVSFAAPPTAVPQPGCEVAPELRR